MDGPGGASDAFELVERTVELRHVVARRRELFRERGGGRGGREKTKSDEKAGSQTGGEEGEQHGRLRVGEVQMEAFGQERKGARRSVKDEGMDWSELASAVGDL